MNQLLKNRIIELLSNGKPVPKRTEIELKYPKRKLNNTSEVTRFCPSPTGFVHIGSIFTAMICKYVADQSNGKYLLRIEDTDKKREVEGARQLIPKQLNIFKLDADEGLQVDGSVLGDYGPYLQSERQQIYLAYVIDLIQNDRAYPCFATSEDLQNAQKDQQSKKMRPGYYGQWALWRDRSNEDISSLLDENKPFVIRFKSEGSHDKRVSFEDVLKGHLEFPENDLDVPLIKSDEWRLPTYHLAHVVDDFLMGATIIMRGEEWLPSTPLHLELADALKIARHKYAHMPLISIIDPNGGGKRKLSKRKDPEADVAYWLQAAYPLKSIKAYLLGLANSNFEEWYKQHLDEPLENYQFSLEKLASSRSPLLDMKKLEDYAKDEISRLSQSEFDQNILDWALAHDEKLYKALTNDSGYTSKVLSIERGGDKPRKDLCKWSDALEQFGYFFDDIYRSNDKTDLEKNACKEFIKQYDHSANKDEWFENMKLAAQASGFALDKKDLKENPEKFKGSLADFAQIIRVGLTGKTRTPDLWTIMQIMGEPRVINRLSS